MSDLYNALGALNSTIQYAGAQIGSVKDKKWIAKENQKARDFQLEMWNKANEYNLPSAQMVRLQEAGLNPNLVYGQGTSTLADYVSAPGHSAPNMNTKDIAKDSIATALQTASLKSGIEVNKSIAAKNEAEAEKARQETRGIAVDSEIKEVHGIELGEIITHSLEKLRWDKGISKEDYRYKKFMNEIYQWMQDNPINVYDAFSGEWQDMNYDQLIYYGMRNAAIKSGFDVNLTKEMVQDVIDSINLKRSQYDKNYSDIELNEYEKLLKAAMTREAISQSNLNNQLAATQPFMRAEIAQNINQSRTFEKVLQSQFDVNQATARKIIKDMALAVQSGNVNAFVHTQTQKFGSGSLATWLNFCDYFMRTVYQGQMPEDKFNINTPVR